MRLDWWERYSMQTTLWHRHKHYPSNKIGQYRATGPPLAHKKSTKSVAYIHISSRPHYSYAVIKQRRPPKTQRDFHCEYIVENLGISHVYYIHASYVYAHWHCSLFDYMLLWWYAIGVLFAAAAPLFFCILHIVLPAETVCTRARFSHLG